MDQLIAGYRRYRAERWPALKELHRTLAEGQRPRTVVVACCDSRVDPATIFDVAPGELFVIRNVANLIPPFEADNAFHGTSAALEFAVNVLEVEEILVLGHARCGGIQAALVREQQYIGYFLGHWVELLEPAKARIGQHKCDDATALEYESIKVSLENLMTFPFVEDRVKAGKLLLSGARYGVADGKLEIYDAKKDAFTLLD